MNKNISQISHVLIPEKILLDTEIALREHGTLKHEGMVFWSGVHVQSNEVRITTCIHPKQICSSYSVDIDLEELQRINILLEESNEIIFAQVHSHPGGVFHSSRDDNLPVTFIVGFLSIVVPYFSEMGLSNLSNCGVWEHEGLGKWRELEISEIEEKFIIIDNQEN